MTALAITIEGSGWELLGKGIVCLACLGLVALVVYLLVFYVVLKG